MDVYCLPCTHMDVRGHLQDLAVFFHHVDARDHAQVISSATNVLACWASCWLWLQGFVVLSGKVYLWLLAFYFLPDFAFMYLLTFSINLWSYACSLSHIYMCMYVLKVRLYIDTYAYPYMYISYVLYNIHVQKHLTFRISCFYNYYQTHWDKRIDYSSIYWRRNFSSTEQN